MTVFDGKKGHRETNDAFSGVEELSEDRKYLETILDTIPLAIVILEAPSGKFLYTNPRAKELYGFQTVGLSLEANVERVKPKKLDGSTYPTTELPAYRALHGEKVLDKEMTLETADGKTYPIFASAAPLLDAKGDTIAAVIIFEDIAERKKAEEALRTAEKKYRDLIETTSDFIWETDTQGRYTYCSPQMETLWGIKPQEMIGKTPFDKMLPEERKKVKELFASLVKSAKPFSGLQVPSLDGRDRLIFIEISGIPFFDANSKLLGYRGITRDITERKRTEEKLEEYTKNLEALVEERTQKLAQTALYTRSLIEASLDPLVTISPEGKITDVNKATELVTGCSREELIGSDFFDYFTEPAKARAGYRQVFVDGFVKDYPLAIRHRSGRITDVLYNASVYRDTDGNVEGIFAAARDVTELRKAERQAEESARRLKDAERLATIGATAGMVGHDIRNPLQAILGDLYLAKDEVASLPDGAAKKNLDVSVRGIEENVVYINKIVSDLQDYTRPLNPVLSKIDLRSICEDVLGKRSIPKNITVSYEIAKNARHVMADPELLKRVINNLVTNAVQAMPNGGELSIGARRDERDVAIEVQDTGVGISEDAKTKLFTPLFTTKSRGQGFGLPVVKRVTEAMNGAVTFESQKGKGTKFIVRLPARKDSS